MLKKLSVVVAVSCLLSACASVPMESKEVSNKAKSFAPPSEGNAGLYIFRDSTLGASLKKDIWVDGKCIGESAPNVFFYEEVKGDMEHKISTESEFSSNDFVIKTLSGENYFVRQYIKFGVFVGGANLELVDPADGKKAVSGLDMATKGNCSK
jgi:hypothetical protein